MKFFILDVHSRRNYRISKDTNGGYGTGNHFGNAAFPRLLTFIKKKTSIFPALSIAYMISCLKKHSHDVLYGNNTSPPKETDVVIIPSSIIEHSAEISWGKKLKKEGFQVGFTGPFATSMPKEYLSAGDFIIKGEPEFFFLNPFKKSDLVGQLETSKDRDLDSLPFPDWSFLNSKSLKYSLFGGGGKFFPMIASRGCPHSCAYYCTYPTQQGKRIVTRSIQNIIAEIEYLKEKYNAKTILFRDPIFSINKKRTLELCNEIIRRKLNIKFVIETHLSALNDELIQKLKEAGLVSIKVGIESVKPEVLSQSHRKQNDKDFQKETIRKLEKNNIKVICFYIFGFPNDTWGSCVETINYSIQLNSTGAQFSVCTPYPGTRFYEEIKDRITANTFDEFTQFQLVWKHDNLTHKQVEMLKNMAYTRYYFRFTWLFKYLKMRYL